MYGSLPPREQRKTDESWGRIRLRIWDRDNGVCQVCGERIRFEHYECGHIVDRVCGGSDLDDNLVVMCSSCNRWKPCHETRQEYDAWVAAGGVLSNPGHDDLFQKHFGKYTEDDQLEMLAVLDRWNAEKDAADAAYFAREDNAAALEARRHIGCRMPRGRSQGQQTYMEALWEGGPDGMTLREISVMAGDATTYPPDWPTAAAGKTFYPTSPSNAMRTLIKRGEIIIQRSLFGRASYRYIPAAWPGLDDEPAPFIPAAPSDEPDAIAAD